MLQCTHQGNALIRKEVMAKMYVGYDGNYGSAEDCDIVFFDLDDLTEEEDEMLGNDPTSFYFHLTDGGKK